MIEDNIQKLEDNHENINDMLRYSDSELKSMSAYKFQLFD